MSDPKPSSGMRKADAICGAKTRSGAPCTQYAVTGATRCRMHGGNSPQVQVKARQRILEAAIRGEAQRMGWEPVTDPIAEYADTAGEILAFRNLAREQVNAMTAWARTSQITQVEQVRAVVEVYERALDRAEKTLARMIQHGMDAATIRLAMQERAERPTMEQAAWAIALVRRAFEVAGIDQTRADEVLIQVTKEAITP